MPDNRLIFYRAAAMLAKSFYEYLSVRLSVCMSVRLSNVNCDKTKAPSEKSSIMTNRKSTTSLR